MKTKIKKVSANKVIVDANKVDAKNVSVISSVLSVKKFVSLDYTKLSAKEQKRFRSQIRRGLFAIVDNYRRLELTKALTKENASENFESFKKYVKENYLIPLTEIENVFKGNGNKLEDWKIYIIAFKEYLSANAKVKAK